MEKLVKQRNKILAFVPKAATAVTFQVSPPLSPGAAGKGFSGPIHVSLIPKDAPRKSKNGSFDAREPASPKVSCMGQIKSKKKKKETVAVGKPKPKLALPPPQAYAYPEEVKTRNRKHNLPMLKMFKGTKRGHKSQVSTTEAAEVAETIAVPSLGQMKQFSSARGGTLSDFDWRACDGTGCVSNPLYEEKRMKSEKE